MIYIRLPGGHYLDVWTPRDYREARRLDKIAKLRFDARMQEERAAQAAARAIDELYRRAEDEIRQRKHS